MQQKSWLPLVYCLDSIIIIPFSWAPLILLFNQCRKSRMPLHVLFSEHRAINTAQPSYDNFTGFRFLNGSNTKLPVCVTVTGSAPSCLSELLQLYSPSHSLRSSSDTRIFKLRRFNRKTQGFRSFSHFGPHIWNNLPLDVRHSTTLFSFKIKLRTFRFSEPFF